MTGSGSRRGLLHGPPSPRGPGHRRPRCAPLAALAALTATGLAAACMAAGLAGACSEPWPAPRGAAELLCAWEESDPGEPGCAALAWRASCAGGPSDPAVERFGLTLRADSDLRSYWFSLSMEMRLPPGASTTGMARIVFSTEAERYSAGSARIEAAWFE